METLMCRLFLPHLARFSFHQSVLPQKGQKKQDGLKQNNFLIKLLFRHSVCIHNSVMFHLSGLSYEWECGVTAIVAGAALEFLFHRGENLWREKLLQPLSFHPFPASPGWLDASN